jgi:hypothetical protein
MPPIVLPRIASREEHLRNEYIHLKELGRIVDISNTATPLKTGDTVYAKQNQSGQERFTELEVKEVLYVASVLEALKGQKEQRNAMKQWLLTEGLKGLKQAFVLRYKAVRENGLVILIFKDRQEVWNKHGGIQSISLSNPTYIRVGLTRITENIELYTVKPEPRNTLASRRFSTAVTVQKPLHLASPIVSALSASAKAALAARSTRKRTRSKRPE